MEEKIVNVRYKGYSEELDKVIMYAFAEDSSMHWYATGYSFDDNERDISFIWREKE
jgi:hypothetical protein